jgi:ferredoxin/flavodoxin
MSAEIYYFSGTGNSLAAARSIAERTGGKCIPIAAVSGAASVRPGDGTVGIVFPNYYGRLPIIVEQFARALTGIENTYIFAVCTFGHGYGDALKDLKRIIRGRGGRVAAWYGIHLTQSAFRKPWENHAKLDLRMRKRAGIIARTVLQKKKGRFISVGLLHALEIPLRAMTKPLILKALRTASGAPETASVEEMIRSSDNGFRATGSCDSCGLCARVCPVKNVTVETGGPVWHHACVNCLACYNWCPKKAIRCAFVQEGYRYLHPEASASDFVIPGR